MPISAMCRHLKKAAQENRQSINGVRSRIGRQNLSYVSGQK
jgi:hypothetical protein